MTPTDLVTPCMVAAIAPAALAHRVIWGPVPRRKDRTRR